MPFRKLSVKGFEPKLKVSAPCPPFRVIFERPDEPLKLMLSADSWAPTRTFDFRSVPIATVSIPDVPASVVALLPLPGMVVNAMVGKLYGLMIDKKNAFAKEGV